MSQKKLVSVIISNYNYGQFLNDAVDSALNQTYKPVEIIVVDDGSTDNSREIIKSYGNRITAILKENEGLISAWNKGYAKSTGDIICFLDSDDYYAPRKVESIVKKYGECPQIGWCFHYLKNVDSSGHSLPKEEEEKDFDGPLDLREDMIKGKTRLSYYMPPTSGLSFKRTLLDQILPIAETIVDPYDKFLQLAPLVLSPGYHIQERLAVRRFHGTNISIRRKKADPFESDINAIQVAYYLRKRYPEVKKFSERLFARSVGRLLVGDRKRLKKIPELKHYLQHYYSINKWVVHFPRMAVNMKRVLHSQLKKR
jgi:glycosyltransferase involved in cell wall biosynthesis